MTALYILRKHPPVPSFYGYGHIAAFTIEAVSESRTGLWKIAQEKNKRSKYKWTVAKLTAQEPKP
jgi:hypothetical protein